VDRIFFTSLDRQHWVFSGLQGGALSDIRVSRIKFLPPGLSSMLQGTKKGQRVRGSVSNLHKIPLFLNVFISVSFLSLLFGSS
jgi:hypothetical protein